ncbi:MAG TPA: hypothetical protein VFZ41_07660 [Solirubrobacterales bacterium]
MGEEAVLVTRVGAAAGSRAAAAALACAGSDAERAGLLIDLGAARPRPSLIATAAARRLEERLAAHLPEAGVASRGRICQISLSSEPCALQQVAGALAVVRESIGVVHLPPPALQPALADSRIRPSGALLCADLARDRALTALAAGDLVRRGVRVAVLKRPLAWIAARLALAGVLGSGDVGLPPRLCRRLLAQEDTVSVFHPERTAEDFG